MDALLPAVRNINCGDSDGYTPLHLAARWHGPDAVAALLEAGASLTAINASTETPLLLGALNRLWGYAVVELLLENGGPSPPRLPPRLRCPGPTTIRDPPPQGFALKEGGYPPPLPTLILQLFPKACPRPQYQPQPLFQPPVTAPQPILQCAPTAL